MKVTPIKTHKLTTKDASIFAVLDQYLLKAQEKSILAISSKVIAITEGRVLPLHTVDRDRLVEKEADYFLPPETNKYGFHITIKHGTIIASAGIDESNGNGFFVLWPKDPQRSANSIRAFLKKKFVLENVGVIIVDSKTSPLRWGVTGAILAHSGFSALKDYVGKPDIFGRPLHVTKANIADGLAAAAAVAMGEGAEQTPIALIEDIPFVRFQKRNPTKDEIAMLKDIAMENDIYAPILRSVKWRRGKK